MIVSIAINRSLCMFVCFFNWLLGCSCVFQRRPKRCESSLDFEFIRECMKINKIRPNAPINVKPTGGGGGRDRAGVGI